MVKNIIVKLQFEGLHCWPECPIEDVQFLRDPHRHIFHVVAKKAVTHNDRDVEIIMLKRSMEKYLQNKYADKDTTHKMGRMSCEDIAQELAEVFKLSYCSVLEDNENGAEVIID